MDPDTSEELGPGLQGEIVVKGPGVTIGYMNNPVANAVARDKNGYFMTGTCGVCSIWCGVYVNKEL